MNALPVFLPSPALLRRLALLLLLALVASPPARAGDAEDATAAVNAFYADYLAQLDKDPRNGPEWLAKSPQLTREFKAAYARALKGQMDADPILCAQDTEPKGVRVTETKEISADAGVLKARWVNPGFSKEALYVHVRKTSAQWQIQRINDFGGPVPASARKYLPERGG